MKIAICVALGFLCVAVACHGGKAAEVFCKDDDAVDMAVYHKLMPVFSGLNLTSGSDGQINDLTVWLSHNYDPSYWNPRFDKQQEAINKVREWAKTLADPCVRKHYNQWLTYYYQVGLDDARKELRTHATEREQAEFNAEGERNRKYREHREKSNPIPSFPDNK